MDFNDTPDQAKFREKCRTWLENNAPYKDGSAKMESFANKDILKEAKEWQKKKYDAGWAMLHWPKEYGGIGATPIERIVWACLLYTSPSPRDRTRYRMPSSA